MNVLNDVDMETSATWKMVIYFEHFDLDKNRFRRLFCEVEHIARTARPVELAAACTNHPGLDLCQGHFHPRSAITAMM